MAVDVKNLCTSSSMCRYPRLAAKICYSAAVSMLQRAEVDPDYFMLATRSPFVEMRQILRQHSIYAEIPPGYLTEQLSFAVKSRWEVDPSRRGVLLPDTADGDVFMVADAA